MRLTGQQLGEARRAFEGTFDPFTLPRFLTEQFGKGPYVLGAPLNGDFSAMVEGVLARTNNEGWIGRLLARARETVPESELFAAFFDGLGVGSGSGAVVGPEKRQVLEDVIKKQSKFLDIHLLVRELTALEYQVCRVEVPTGQNRTLYGTGFLVAPDLVMTNYHVVEAVDAGEQGRTTHEGLSAKAAQVRCRFDYARVSNEVLSQGTVFTLAQNWKYDVSHWTPPGPGNLDYAILRLAKAAGNEAIGPTAGSSGKKRGFIPLPDADYPFAAGTPLFILQHPSAMPLKLALDSDGVVGVNADRTRVTYTTNTEQGSSGAPCFTQDLLPVALHHAGDPGFPDVAAANEGIPLATIRRLLRERGLEGGLG